MSQITVVIGIVLAFLVLWWVTRHIAKGDRGKQSTAMQRENNELRHVVMEMAKEKHHHSRDEHRH
jgi:flagellar biosynthesis/type III secretory pathway M-ring protein FliF/YscJ